MYVKVMKKDLGSVYYERISEPFVVDTDEYFFKSSDYANQRNLLDAIVFCDNMKSVINESYSKFGVIAISAELFTDNCDRLNDILKSIKDKDSTLRVIPEPKKIKNESEEYYCISEQYAVEILYEFDEIAQKLSNIIDDCLKDGLYAVFCHGEIYYCLSSYISKSNPYLTNKSFLLVDESGESINFDYVGTGYLPSIGKNILSVADCINNIVIELINE